jgi:hypothetical protein
MCSGTQRFLARYGNRWFITDLTVATSLGLILIQINPVNTDKWSMEQLIKSLKAAQLRKYYNSQ